MITQECSRCLNPAVYAFSYQSKLRVESLYLCSKCTEWALSKALHYYDMKRVLLCDLVKQAALTKKWFQDKQNDTPS